MRQESKSCIFIVIYKQHKHINALLIAIILAAVLSGYIVDAHGQQQNLRTKVQFVNLGDNVKLAYYERGQGPPLLMNIGSVSTMSEWDPALLRKLAQHHKLIIYDYHGIGWSSKISQSKISIQVLADEAVALLDRLGIAKADILGWSLGGFVAQQIAIRHPKHVNRVILAATNPGGRHTVFGPEYAQRIDSNPKATDKQVLSVNFPRTRVGREAAKSFLSRLENAAQTGEIPNDFRVSRSGYNAQLDAENRWDASNQNYQKLKSIGIPVLVMDGRQDLLTPVVNSMRIARSIPNSHLRLFRSTGHAFLFQDSARFTRLVDQFLNPDT